MKLLYILFVLLLINFCSEEKPTFPEEYKQVSIPQKGVLPYFKGILLDPIWIDSKEEITDEFKNLNENFQFTTQKNKVFTNRNLLGKFTLVYFFFAECRGVCPMITSSMKTILPKIKNQSDLQILAITIHPENDKPEVLEKFKNRFKITQENWIFLTGPKTLIYDLARNQFNADVQSVRGGETDLTDFVHTENVYLLDKKGYLRGAYRGKGTGDLERLVLELETLRQEN